MRWMIWRVVTISQQVWYKINYNMENLIIITYKGPSKKSTVPFMLLYRMEKINRKNEKNADSQYKAKKIIWKLNRSMHCQKRILELKKRKSVKTFRNSLNHTSSLNYCWGVSKNCIIFNTLYNDSQKNTFSDITEILLSHKSWNRNMTKPT